jgi:hypothetical protein
MKYEILVDQRNDAAFATHRANGIGFFFAEQSYPADLRSSEVVVNDCLNASAKRSVQIDDSAADQFSARDAYHNSLDVFPLLVVERILLVSKDGHFLLR